MRKVEGLVPKWVPGFESAVHPLQKIPAPAYSKMEKAKPTQTLIKGMYAKQAPVWKALAKELSRARRKQAVVNLAKRAKLTKPDEAVVVPGKVLGTGNLPHKLTIAAFQFSKTAKEKLKGKCMTIEELMKKPALPKGVRIIK
jgi:large subunit ribosomal protein L18e